MASYFLPSVGGQLSSDPGSTPYQSSPLLNTYSPRLFGAPPQLTNKCDMRLMSSLSGSSTPGPVGDFYLTKILRNAQVANFCVGRALFTGGSGSIPNMIRTAAQYGYAMSKYNIFDSSGSAASGTSAAQAVVSEYNMNTYNSAMNSDDGTLGEESSLKSSASGIFSSVASLISNASGLLAPMLDASLQSQAFYTFESDWYTYINNVKMMINTAVIMLGLQSACVRIGDKFYPIGMKVNVTKDTDVWSNYRFITPSSGLGDVTAIDTQTGDTSQYVSFMIDPSGMTEDFKNNTGESQIYSSVINQGGSIGNEIAFITNSSSNKVDDAVIKLTGNAVSAAEAVLSSMTAGAGRFTAAIAGSMARSYTGDHNIYPKVFQDSSSTSSFTIKTKFTATSGDPYAYLTDMLVPYFFVLGMALPKMSNNGPSAYAFPPLVQCNIPGMWGTRLGMITSVTVDKDASDISVNGYPLSMTVSITIEDLQHSLVTSPMNQISTFLNNSTMFDYIAQCSGVDKYRLNGAIRLVSKLALAGSATKNLFNNVGDAILNDFASFANRLTGSSKL